MKCKDKLVQVIYKDGDRGYWGNLVAKDCDLYLYDEAMQHWPHWVCKWVANSGLNIYPAGLEMLGGFIRISLLTNIRKFIKDELIYHLETYSSRVRFIDGQHKYVGYDSDLHSSFEYKYILRAVKYVESLPNTGET